MGTPLTKNFHIPNHCIITTSSRLTQYYNNATICTDQDTCYSSCISIDDIYSIISAYHYEIMIDFQNEDITILIETLLNTLISRESSIHVKVISPNVLDSPDIHKCLSLLKKLKLHRFIELSILSDHELREPKFEPSKISAPSMKNVLCFIGPGNTGKTSIISSLGFLFQEKGHKIALLDLTEHRGLINYFSAPTILNTQTIKNDSTLLCTKKEHTKYGDVDLYIFSHECTSKSSEIIYLYEFIHKLSNSYDWVFVNTDITVVSSLPQIFHLGDKTFVVQDFMPTKIDVTKSILMYLEAAGINTVEKISLIYNKKIKGTVSLENIEENMLFRELPEDRLSPLVDINCNTFEINYDKKTMAAMINHLVAGTYTLKGTSRTYRQNIHRIYEFICNGIYTEVNELNIQTCIQHYSLWLIKHFFAIKNHINKRDASHI